MAQHHPLRQAALASVLTIMVADISTFIKNAVTTITDMVITTVIQRNAVGTKNVKYGAITTITTIGKK